MTEPHVTVDPTAVILARMEVKLDNALTEIGKHSSTLDKHETAIGEQGNRLTALETTVGTLPKKAVAPIVVWSAIALAVTALGVLAAFLSVH